MKNVINYYYGFNIENIHQVNGVFYFTYLTMSYMLKPFKQEVNEIYRIYQLNLITTEKNHYFHKMILNRNGEPFTMIDGKCYLLIQLSNVIHDPISIYDLSEIKIDVTRDISSLVMSDWYYLWTTKVDYLEYKLEHMKGDTNILPIYHFFIGLSENTISYVKSSFDKYPSLKSNLVVSHRRMNESMNLVDYYDPVDLVIDYKCRDLAEFIKSTFISGTFDYQLLEEYLTVANFNELEYSLFMARVLFPSYFYDHLEETEILYQINIDQYIEYLKDVYDIIRRRSLIDEIKWLK